MEIEESSLYLSCSCDSGPEWFLRSCQEPAGLGNGFSFAEWALSLPDALSEGKKRGAIVIWCPSNHNQRLDFRVCVCVRVCDTYINWGGKIFRTNWTSDSQLCIWMVILAVAAREGSGGSGFWGYGSGFLNCQSWRMEKYVEWRWKCFSILIK